MLDLTVHVNCWNEERLLPYFLRFYAFASKIVIHDNESTDRTLEIAAADPRVEVRTFSTGGRTDTPAFTEQKNQGWKGATTQWVIVVDLDEFLVFDPALLKIWDGKQVAFQATGWQMIGDDQTDLLDIRRAFRHKVMDKTLLFSASIDDINYSGGAHVARPTCPVVQATEARHYILGEQYLIDRWKQYQPRTSDYDRKHRLGYHHHFSEERVRAMCAEFRDKGIDFLSLREMGY